MSTIIICLIIFTKLFVACFLKLCLYGAGEAYPTAVLEVSDSITPFDQLESECFLCNFYVA